jgi:uncharacterized protein (DUF1501 family)
MDFTRRSLLRAGAGTLLGALVSQWAERLALADGPQAARPGKARSVILLWMNGGPSHIDTWDPKPGTRVGGPHKAIKTSTPGLSISEHLPKMADLASQIAVVRGMTSKEGNHQRAQYLLHTGYAPNPTVVHPSLGGWVSKKLGGPTNGLPAFVSIGGPSLGAGFLGVQHGPFVMQKGGDPPQNVGFGPQVDEARFAARQKILESMERSFAAKTGDPKVDGHRAVYEKADRLMHSPDLSAFDLGGEKEDVKKAFGDSDFGRGCLVASRLVAAGVPFVEVVLDGWDTHQNNFERTKRLMGVLDPAMSALYKELEKKRLLDSTLVAWMGDFGRTPRINGNDGRDHHPGAWSAVLGGAGIKKGVVHGETDAEGAKVVKDAVTVPDLLATVATVLGFDPRESFLTPIGRPIAITENGTPVAALLR